MERYVMSIILDYVHKYVEQFKPEHAEVSLFRGDVSLYNLLLKTDVLQKELPLPFTLVSGRINALCIHVSWASVATEPIVVKIDTLECTLSQRKPTEEEPTQSTDEPIAVGTPPSYMQGLIRRIVNSISLQINHLILKYVDDDIVLSLNVNNLAVHSMDDKWVQAVLADNIPEMRRQITIDDLTLCLDKTEADGRINFYQEPLLCRCKLLIRVLTIMASPVTREAICHRIQLSSSNLAFGMTNEQLVLLLRLLKNLNSSPVSSSNKPSTSTTTQTDVTNRAPFSPNDSWAKWAWSWLPSWMEDPNDIPTAARSNLPKSIGFLVRLDNISMKFKMMKTINNRKRPQDLLEIHAKYTAIRGLIRDPTLCRFKIGIQRLVVWNRGACCNSNNKRTILNQDMLVLSQYIGDVSFKEHKFQWPEEDLENYVENSVETMAHEVQNLDIDPQFRSQQEFEADIEEQFWKKVSPLIVLEYHHERSPSLNKPNSLPMSNFEYSDWVEQCSIYVKLKDTDLLINTGLIHRINIIREILESCVTPKELVKKILTLEECEALTENIPQKRLNFDWHNMRIRLAPCDHSAVDTDSIKLFMVLDCPLMQVAITAPLYDHRVCSAACQIAGDENPLWNASRAIMSAKTKSIQLAISSTALHENRKSISTFDFNVIIRYLLHKDYFINRNSIILNYSLKINELALCSSAPRLLLAVDTAISCLREEISYRIKDTSLYDDAFEDEALAAIDMNIEGIFLQGSITDNTLVNSGSVTSIRATVLRATSESELKVAWLFSGPEMQTKKPFIAFLYQYTPIPTELTLDYIRVDSSSMALSLDPMFYEYITYRPTVFTIPKGYQLRRVTEPSTSRKNTPPSSSGRGGSRAESSAELVHSARHHSQSSDTASEMKDPMDTGPIKPTRVEESWWSGDKSIKLYQRYQRTLIDMSTERVMCYAVTSSPSAVGTHAVWESIEKHTFEKKSVLGLSFARCSIESNSALQHLATQMRTEKPNLFKVNPIAKEDCFPWKIQIVQTSLYTLETKTEIPQTGKEKSPEGLRSCLTTSIKPEDKKVLSLIDISCTIPIIIKRLPARSAPSTSSGKYKKKYKAETSTSAEAVKYLSSGVNFKPTTLKDFVRGPKTFRVQIPENAPEEPTVSSETRASGPISSICLGVHLVTSPITISIEDYQVQTLMSGLHCLDHFITAFAENPAGEMLDNKMCCYPDMTTNNEELHERKRNTEELVSIYEAPQELSKMKTSIWFQWVADKIDISFKTESGGLFLELEDILSSIDLQASYKQHKIKVQTANLRYHTRKHDNEQFNEWVIDPLRSKVIHNLETKKASDVPYFLHVTITRATTESLPPNWKPDYILSSSRSDVDSVSEVLVKLASFKLVLRPEVIKHFIAFSREVSSTSTWLNKNHKKRPTLPAEWPLIFINCAGLSVLVTNEFDEQNDDNDIEEDTENSTVYDDTLIFDMGKIELQPYPNNPICRKALSSDVGRLAARGSIEGKQYEVTIDDICVKTGRFRELVEREATRAEASRRMGGQNPAAIWTQQQAGGPITTPIVDSLKIGCILAPAMSDSAGFLIYSQGLELNIMSDLTIELSLYQLNLLWTLACSMNAYTRNPTMHDFEETPAHCLTYVQLPAFKICKPRVSYYSSRRLQKRKSISTDSGVNIENVPTLDPLQTHPDRSRSPSPESDKTECLEVFLTMGNVELSLYVIDDGKNELLSRIPPTPLRKNTEPTVLETENTAEETLQEPSDDSKRALSMSGSQSVENVRPVEAAAATLNLGLRVSPARKRSGVIPLCYFFFQQPNMYLIHQQGLTKLQLSLFNTQIGFGARGIEGLWHDVLIDTAPGISDPVTDIPPALFTLKATKPNEIPGSDLPNAPITGKLYLDVERPVSIDVTEEKIERTKLVSEIIQSIFGKMKKSNQAKKQNTLFFNFKNTMENMKISDIVLTMTQFSINGQMGTISFDSLVHQIASSSRPERLCMRSLIKGLMITMGSSLNPRHPLLHPFMFGFEVDCNWKNGPREEGNLTEHDFNMKMLIEIDNIIIDVRPRDVFDIIDLIKTVQNIISKKETEVKAKPRRSYTHTPECNKHLYYNNDLRSGAFKVLTDGKFPITYQLHVHGDLLTWTYPNLRAIRKLTILPLPEEEEDAQCVLEYYCEMFEQWEPHTYFKLSATDTYELQLNQSAPDAVFAHTWRFRLYPKLDEEHQKFVFQDRRFLPRNDPLGTKNLREVCLSRSGQITAQQLFGLIVLDSFSCSCTIPITRISSRVGSITLHFHNTILDLPRCTAPVGGYYLSSSLRKSHRMLSVVLSNECLRYQETEKNRSCTTFETFIKCNIMDSATGTFEELMEESHLQASLVKSRPNDFVYNRIKCRISLIAIKMHVPRLRTFESLANDWLREHLKYLKKETGVVDEIAPKEEGAVSVENLAEILDGRVSFWIKNETAFSLRIGQKGTTEVVSLGPGMSLAYRWHSPLDDKKMHFALGCLSLDVIWSNGLDIIDGENRLQLTNEKPLGGEVFLYTRVETIKSVKWLYLSGRVVLANMMKFNVLYKVKALEPEKQLWRTIFSGELPAETSSQSVLCGDQCDLLLKIKTSSQEMIWSGDIPLRPSPKEVPWLVKVPTSGDLPYVSMWCRVLRAESDGRMLATIWPLYMLRSNLPLDTLIYVKSESDDDVVAVRHSIQNAAGRGKCSHLLIPGTTFSKHTFKFRYRDMDTPVTREDILLNYSISRTTVFEKKPPIKNITDSIIEVDTWLKSSKQNSDTAWPFSIVAKHINGPWKPTILQPRANINIRYLPVKVGGGSSLEIVVSPALLLCNAYPAAVTLRGYDANPVCRAEHGCVIAPESRILERAFYLSLEMNRAHIFGQPIKIWRKPIGQYEDVPEGHVAVDHPAIVYVITENTFTLINLYYEVVEGLQLLGVTSTHAIINHLGIPIKVFPVIIPKYDDLITIPTRNSKIIFPHESNDWIGTTLGTFSVFGKWHYNKVCSLQKYICLTFEDENDKMHPPLPIKIEGNLTRKAISLNGPDGNSMPILITQHIIDKRCYITLAPDVCPQYYIKNLTSYTIAVAEPTQHDQGGITTVPDCIGGLWYYKVKPDSFIYYTTPSHCVEFPRLEKGQALKETKNTSLIVAICHDDDDNRMQWSQPFKVAVTKHWLKFDDQSLITVFTRENPHSTLIKLENIQNDDIAPDNLRNFISTEDFQLNVLEFDRMMIDERGLRKPNEWLDGKISRIVIEIAASAEAVPLIVLFLDDIAVSVQEINNKDTLIEIAAQNIQVDNPHYDYGEYDFAVVANTNAPRVRKIRKEEELCNIFSEKSYIMDRFDNDPIQIQLLINHWELYNNQFKELTEFKIRVSPISLYIEDSYLRAIVDLYRLTPGSMNNDDNEIKSDALALRNPLRLRRLEIESMEVILTLHTAVRLYIALDESPMSLSEFGLQNIMTSSERLSQALTVHYLSAALLGAGWVVGGLELLGAPGAIASRVGNATGGIRGVATATAAAFIKSISAWAASLARNLDLLAGDDEHTQRAAAIRRRPPDRFFAGLVQGFSNFGINLLGAVGGIAHHPLVGVAVGENGSAMGLRRGLVGAVTKPLSAAADLVAIAGNSLLRQAGWDPTPERRVLSEASTLSYWARNCIRWSLRLPNTTVLDGYEVLLNDVPVHLLVTYKALVVGEPETEKILEIIEFQKCVIEKRDGPEIVMSIKMDRQRRERRHTEDDEYQMSDETLARLARYTGTLDPDSPVMRPQENRRIIIETSPTAQYSLLTIITSLIHQNDNCHFNLL